MRAAELAAARGEAEEALALFRDAEAWEAMCALIHAHALEWARQGRAQALSDWIDALPADRRDGDPWLVYWQGRAWIFAQPHRGRPTVVRAYEAFQAAGDVRFVFPNAPEMPVTINGGYRMPAWYDILGPGGPEDEAGLRRSQAAIESLIAAEAARGIPASRIVLAGFSQGDEIGLGTRGKRYSILVNDGVVEQLNVEAPGAFEVSSAEYLLGQL